MPKFDNPTRRLMQTRTHDWIRLVYPDCREEWIQPLETEIRPAKKSQLDGVYRIDDGEKIIYMNLEPQACLDLALPIRMLRYRADIWAYAQARRAGFQPAVK